MSPREAILLVYGLIFGTSTPYLKPKNRFLFPTAIFSFDKDLKFFLGGSGICAELRSGTDLLIVNTNQSDASNLWAHELRRNGGIESSSLVLNSLNGVFGDATQVTSFAPRAVFAHAEDLNEHPWLAGVPFKNVEHEITILVGDETVHLIPVSGCATTSDLVVFFEKRSVMMLGSLFSNRIHPQLYFGAAARAKHWIETLEMLMLKYAPAVVVPGEGQMGSIGDVQEFVRYLKALTDPNVDFSYCRENFDWTEIPSATSLEENFDILRRNVKTHTSMN